MMFIRDLYFLQIMIEITDINDERIKHYQNLRFTPTSHIEGKIFIAEGDIVVRKLLSSDFEVLSIFAEPHYYKKYEQIIKSKGLKPDYLYYANKMLMESIVGYRLHSGIMAIARQPEQISLTDLKSPVVILNSIINSENVGSIIRNCAAFGIQFLIVDNKSSSPYLRRSVRVSMGAVLSIHIHFTDSLKDSLYYLKSKGFKIIAAELTENSKDFNKFDFPDKFGIIFGSEGDGILWEILDICDTVLHIPITQNIESLNVSAASAIFLNCISKLKD
jgi:tRNA G18 (ribose-2'-O)-methylase SpoU